MVEVTERKREFSLGKPEEVDDFTNSNIPSPRKVQETSILSKNQVDLEGTAIYQRDKILRFVKQNPGVCIREIAEGINIQKSSVSPRLSELRDDGKIISDGKKKYKNRLVLSWKANGSKQRKKKRT